MSKLVAVNSVEEFHKVVNEGELVVVDFYAKWCGPCRLMMPKVEKFSKEFDTVKFIKVDVDENETIASSVGISAMPTFKFYKGGNIIDEVVGVNPGQLKTKIIEYMD
ncbi:Thioredoxin-1 [Zancudomyces culisetae]|uniref:Thioredoxin n=1 Tax=Zancudomyces culisetae TaxID=1213189 RepID=A0A1R1PUI3_ZANCU|nr:Thioredoxin-1 [Zancudomyces culisetae]|eukprot:OMH84640.1 Thioredoxin-1 [Zancudomyces culisetae]